MTKNEFTAQIYSRLKGMPEEDLARSLDYYSEMIDDRIEEGVTEEDAILEIGSVDEIASAVVADIPLSKIAKERIKPKKTAQSVGDSTFDTWFTNMAFVRYSSSCCGFLAIYIFVGCDYFLVGSFRFASMLRSIYYCLWC